MTAFDVILYLSTYKRPASDFMASLKRHGEGVSLGLEVHLSFIVRKVNKSVFRSRYTYERVPRSTKRRFDPFNYSNSPKQANGSSFSSSSSNPTHRQHFSKPSGSYLFFTANNRS